MKHAKAILVVLAVGGALFAQAPARRIVRLTDQDYYNCSAIAAVQEGQANGYARQKVWEKDFAELMREQREVIYPILRKDTIMYRWEKKGQRICWTLAAQGKKPEFPRIKERPGHYDRYGQPCPTGLMDSWLSETEEGHRYDCASPDRGEWIEVEGEPQQ